MAEYIASSLVQGQDRQLLVQQLAGYLIDSGRTKELDLIVRDIEFSLAEKGIVEALVVSAFELAADTKKELEAFVKAQTQAKRVSLSSIVDPTVLGGVKITAAGRELNQTILNQLTVLKTRFKKA